MLIRRVEAGVTSWAVQERDGTLGPWAESLEGAKVAWLFGRKD